MRLFIITIFITTLSTYAFSNITSTGLNNIQCNDNGTPWDDTDDFITFELDPVGTGLGINYQISSGANPVMGFYGAPTIFTMPPGSATQPPVNFTISDISNPSCNISFTIQPTGPCSPVCQIITEGLTNVVCDDNNTPWDDTDDVIRFDLDPMGFNLGVNYQVFGPVVPALAFYNGPTSFSLMPGTAGGGPQTLTLADISDPNCTFTFTVPDPGSCSTQCLISDVQLNNVVCDDSNTPWDDTDDAIQFELNPIGFNLGPNYQVFGPVVPALGFYGSPTIFTLIPGTAGAGPVTLTLEDITDPSCSFTFTIPDPGSCSTQCLISDVQLNNVVCDDSNTPWDDTDDAIQFELDPIGFNLGLSYQVFGPVIPALGFYGSPTIFTLMPGTAGGGPVTLTLADIDDPSCSINFTIPDPGSCSMQCLISDVQLNNVICDDSNTPWDDTDDAIQFELDPIGFNLGPNYQVLGPVVPALGFYGSPTIFTLMPGTSGGGPVTLTLADINDPSCSINFTIPDPGSCSTQCLISDVQLNIVICDDSNTPWDDTDDVIQFELDPIGFNLGPNYQVLGPVVPALGFYGSPTIFTLMPGTAGGGSITLTLEDINDPSCSINFTIPDPGSCSTQCLIDDVNLTNVLCNNNGTPMDPTDDYIVFDLDPAGFNLGSNYQILGSVVPAQGTYGMVSSFSLPAGSAGAGDIVLTLQDNQNMGQTPPCEISFTITDPDTCSGLCSIDNVNLTNVICDDNNTPWDSSDDFIKFDVNPTGNNLGINYQILGSVIPAQGTYGSVSTFSLPPGSAGSGDLVLTIQDNQNMGQTPPCEITFTVADSGTCSTQCLIDDVNLTNVMCDDNGTPMDPTDDYILFDLDPSGFNLGSNYQILGSVVPAQGTYGTVSSFSLPAGSAGAGDIVLTLQDNQNLGQTPTCEINFTITDPGPCSMSPCNISDAGLGIVSCFNGTTTTDPSDDQIIFELNPSGTGLGSDYFIDTNPAGALPVSASYGTITAFSMPPGTAGNGSVTVTIIDMNDASCSHTFVVNDPGNCSMTSTIDLVAAPLLFKVFPNPSKGEFIIDLLEANVVSVELKIYNQIGDELKHHREERLENRIKVQCDYPQGIYHIHLLDSFGKSVGMKSMFIY